MTVRIVTDSSACLPPDLAEEHRIGVVPIHLTIDGEERLVDEVAREELLQRLGEGHDVHTSAPTPGQFLETVEAVQEGDGVVVLTLASSMSATHDAASMGASMAEGGEARVVDSGTAAGGHGLIALAGARAAEAGADLDEVEAVCRGAADQVRLLAVVGSLEALARSGRVPSVASKAGDAFGVRPLFEFRRGEPQVLMPSLSREGSLDRILSKWRSSQPEGGGQLHVTALHADDREEAQQLLARIRDEVEPAAAFVSEFDAAMMVHTGTDLVGLAWWWDEG